MKRTLSLIALAAATSLMVACGNNTDNQGSSAPVNSEAASSAASAASDATAADSASTTTISQKDAEETALTSAGIARADVTNWNKSELDSDDARPHWEIEFTADGKEYEYQIDANDGTVTEIEQDVVE